MTSTFAMMTPKKSSSRYTKGNWHHESPPSLANHLKTVSNSSAILQLLEISLWLTHYGFEYSWVTLTEASNPQKWYFGAALVTADTHLPNILHLWQRKSVFAICNSACHFNATMNLFKQSLYMLVIWMRLCRIKYHNRYYKVLVCFALAFLSWSVSSGKRKIDKKKNKENLQ